MAVCYNDPMELTLAPETRRLIEEKLKQGVYHSADDLICKALAALSEIQNELDDETLDALDEAQDAIERGDVHEWEDVKKHIRERLATKRAMS
jgi:Arc/MetJ-type ribon-helix-helix transcriptional regulator